MPDSPQPPLVDRLLGELGPDHSNGLRIGGINVAEIAARFGTPAYVYDAAVLRRRYAAVTEKLGVDLLYAVKANPCVAVAKVFADLGAGADVASAGEVLIAARAGFPGDRIQFAGPGKNRGELDLAVSHGIQKINLESVAEYETLIEVAVRRDAANRGARPSVAIRVNPARGVAEARMRMGGGPSKFGIDAEAVEDLVRRILDDGVVELGGVHCYLGTQMFDSAAWLDSVRELFGFVRELESTTGVELPALNLGGGFGVPCFDGEPAFDLDAAAAGLREIFADDRRELCVELGRYLTAPAGVFLTRVLYLKESHGRRYVILDGGLHHFGAATGLGAVIRRPFPIVAVAEPHATTTRPQALCGPLCTPADEFGSAVFLPELAPGDIVAILAAGAYGLTYSPALFLSHPSPREILVDGGQASLVREAGRPEDALRGQFLPGEA